MGWSCFTRRSGFILSIIIVIFTLPPASSAEEEVPLRSLDPPVLLPDGSEFKTWEEAAPEFTRTYHVDPRHPAASDENEGTGDRPFATIQRAAEALRPGERVVVAGGIYRERVRPRRGGSGPGKMISYEAALGEKVVIKGSRVFKPLWSPSAPAGKVPSEGAWQAKLDPSLFQDYNPFDVENVTQKQFESMSWATPLRGKPPCVLPRGLVFQDERILAQIEKYEDLASREGAYWVDRPAQVIHLRPFGGADPRGATWEITTQETVFAPEEIGLGFIRVKGFLVEEAAGPFPWEQVGAISTGRGHHWIIEENTVRFANGVGIDLGSQHPRLPQPEVIGHHIVRKNTVTDCGICGICGLGPGQGKDFGLLIEDNHLARNAFHDVERLYETGGIKTHNNIRCLIRRNLISDTIHGPGIWMDWDNQHSRCSRNVIVGTRTLHGGIFVEASYLPNLIDQNFIWGTEGHGIYEHDSCRQVFAHNFIGKSTGCGLHLHGKITDRRISGRPIVGGSHRVLNNILFANGKEDVFLGEPSAVAGNLDRGISASFDPEAKELTWIVSGKAPACEKVDGLAQDFRGKPRGDGAPAPGPFRELPEREVRVRLWPIGGPGDPLGTPPQAAPGPTGSATFLLRGEVVDAATGKIVACRIYIQDEKGDWFFPRSAASEGSAVRYQKQNWVNKSSVECHTSLSAHPFEVDLAPGRYTVEAERGKEYRTGRETVEVKDGPVSLRLPIERWIDMAERGWYSGDTHVHRTVDELSCAMLAEDLNVSFPLVWWVTRAATPPAAGDKNAQVPSQDLIALDRTHVIATRNTEYEIFTAGGKSHTLGAFFALNHGQALEAGAPPVRPIAEEAHRRGALLDLEKHDWPWSIALVPVMGVDLFELANNHLWRTEFAFRSWSTPGAPYMGLPGEGRSGGEIDWILYGLETYYALLNSGFRLKPAAGTASGVHPVPLGFSRVYVHLEGDFSFEDWFKGLGEGRSFATTGPMLLVKVQGRHPGHVFEGKTAKEYTIGATAVSASPLAKVEIVLNGKVVRSLAPAHRKNREGGFESAFEEKIEIKGSSWLALRAFEERPGGRVRFAHTGPFWFEVPGSPLRPSREEAEFLLRRVRDEIDRSTGVLPPAAIEEYEKAREVYEGILKGLHPSGPARSTGSTSP